MFTSKDNDAHRAEELVVKKIHVTCVKGNALWGVGNDVLHGCRHGLFSRSVDDDVIFPSNAMIDF